MQKEWNELIWYLLWKMSCGALPLPILLLFLFSLSLSCGRDMRSPVAGSRVMTRNYTAVSLKEQKKPTLSQEPRDFDTRVRTKPATRSKNYSFMNSLHGQR